MRWLIDRFAGVGTPDWAAPAEPELAEHFSVDFLARVPPGELTATLGQAAPLLDEELTVLDTEPLTHPAVGTSNRSLSKPRSDLFCCIPSPMTNILVRCFSGKCRDKVLIRDSWPLGPLAV